MDASPPRVYIVDEHDRVRRALADRLTRAGSLAVLGDSAQPEDALAAVGGQHVAVVLVEVKRSDGLGLELVRQLVGLPSRPRVIVLTSYPTAWEEAAVRRAGAAAYLLKDLETDLLVGEILSGAV